MSFSTVGIIFFILLTAILEYDILVLPEGVAYGKALVNKFQEFFTNIGHNCTIPRGIEPNHISRFIPNFLLAIVCVSFK